MPCCDWIVCHGISCVDDAAATATTPNITAATSTIQSNDSTNKKKDE